MAMARGLGADVVAEGVETPQQCAVLRELGCVSMQGYLFSHPLPADDATDQLAQQLIHGRGRPRVVGN
jgi:EAL domain-containing protein (putative c-di-GMP-specific phosphodiesterase class I)